LQNEITVRPVIKGSRGYDGPMLMYRYLHAAEKFSVVVNTLSQTSISKRLGARIIFTLGEQKFDEKQSRQSNS